MFFWIFQGNLGEKNIKKNIIYSDFSYYCIYYKVFYMNKSQRIWVNINEPNQDKHIQVKLEQDIDTFEIMSLKVDTKDVYQDFNADYGVLVGRITANKGVGIPNTKVSIFIPLDEEDENNSEIVSVYPYKNPREKNNEGKRYNLLPRVGKIDPETGLISPKQPVGSFPIKEEVVTNPTYLEVYKKYYKYSTVTNDSGDYMIFGVPVGTQTVHMSADITDIGQFSMSPAAMVKNLGYSPNLFSEDGTRIKLSEDLDELPNVETQEVSVDVIPFWGDSKNFTIGITRQDFKIRAQLNYNFVLFGSAFTDGNDRMWGSDFNSATNDRAGEYYRAKNGVFNMSDKRIGRITENVYYYPSDITEGEINSSDFDATDKAIKLDPSEYSIYKRDGDFVFIISCNRGKIITSETGEDIPVDDNYNGGVFKEFWGFITLEYTNENISMDFSDKLGNEMKVKPLRYRFKFPQSNAMGHSFCSENPEDLKTWKKQYQKFIGGNYYTLARFHSQNEVDGDKIGDSYFKNDKWDNNTRTFTPLLINKNGPDPNWNVGTIKTSGNENTPFDFPSNWSEGGDSFFGGNWMNFTIYFPQVGYGTTSDKYDQVEDMRVNDNFTSQPKTSDYVKDNTHSFVGGTINTKWFARSDLHQTKVVETSKEEIKAIFDATQGKKGFTDGNISDVFSLNNKFMNATKGVPSKLSGGGTVKFGYSGNKNLTNSTTDDKYYFYKGYDDADCLQYLDELGLL